MDTALAGASHPKVAQILPAGNSLRTGGTSPRRQTPDAPVRKRRIHLGEDRLGQPVTPPELADNADRGRVGHAVGRITPSRLSMPPAARPSHSDTCHLHGVAKAARDPDLSCCLGNTLWTKQHRVTGAIHQNWITPEARQIMRARQARDTRR